MKRLVILSLLLSSSLAFASFSSKPSDVKKFEATGQCPSCDLSGYQMLATNATGSMDLQGADLIKTFILMPIKTNRQNSNFSNVMGTSMNYANADLSYSNFTNAKLSHAQLESDNFTGVDFTGADLSTVNFTSSILYKAKISKAQLASVASLCDAILPDGSKGKCN